jgi:hypothetical protein
VPPCAFYVVGDARFFPGVVALVNSLRLVGHDEPIVVLDCGFEERQRRVLEREAALLEPPAGGHPAFLKWVAPLERPADVMVLVDSDMIAVRSLAPLVARAAAGRVVAFVDLDPHRFREEWRDWTGVASLPRRTCANSGLVALPRSGGLELLELLQEVQERLPLETGPADELGPLIYRDQDVLNAVLGAHRAEDDVELLEQRLAPCPPFYGLRVVDERSLECRFRDGAQPFVLHHIDAKPWLALTPPTPYSRLLPRLLLADDVAVRLEPDDLPLQLRPGLLPALVRGVVELRWLATRSRFKLRLALSRTGSGSGS